MADDDLQAALTSSTITRPLLDELERHESDAELLDQPIHIVLDLNAEYRTGQDGAAERVNELLMTAVALPTHHAPPLTHRPGRPFMIGSLPAPAVRALVESDVHAAEGDLAERAVFRIWPDFPIAPLLDRSGATIKADAAKAAYGARGREIVWAVLDSGIDATHPHFSRFANLRVESSLPHHDFTGDGDPCTDAYGHGTHVAGIIAGEGRSEPGAPLIASRRERAPSGDIAENRHPITEISGIAPEAALLSFKVLADDGTGRTGPILEALDEVQRLNSWGRNIRIHGVNLSLGYGFDPEWFACGQSPLCQEVDRLVRSGVVVVVAAGNTGYASARDSLQGRSVEAGRALTINDPGNAGEAITVGSTHRYMPHTYGVSYFSSKGPTGDGRAKPDILAPGEKILSAATGTFAATTDGAPVHYAESTGTSMSAPHVSGALAAFMSIRPEFVGRPADLKRIFLANATDLERVRDFQGHGLLDLMRALSSV